MRAVTSHNLADFAEIYEPDVELVSVNRSRAASELDARAIARRRIGVKWSQTAGDRSVVTDQVNRALASNAHTSLVDEIDGASQMLADLLGCESVGIRIATLNGPMCPKFHRDHVHCRLLVTLLGPGTEWIANGDVDDGAFEDRTTTSVPVIAGKSVRHLEPGAWSLLKGGLWDAATFDGVVHRSPHYDGDRLLISIDPLFMRQDN